MAIVVLTRLWVNLVSTGEAVSAEHKPYAPRTASVDGQVERYAGGRLRGTYQLGTAYTLPFTLLRCDLAIVEKLESWIGQVVQVRDWRGQRFYGQYWQVATSPRRPFDMYEPTIQLETISRDEGV